MLAHGTCYLSCVYRCKRTLGATRQVGSWGRMLNSGEADECTLDKLQEARKLRQFWAQKLSYRVQYINACFSIGNDMYDSHKKS